MTNIYPTNGPSRGIHYLNPDALNVDAGQLLNTNDDAGEAFLVKSANEWLEHEGTRPMPNKLFGEFWYQGELCILFSDTNIGKSILAVQLGNSLTRAEAIAPFTFEGPSQTVLYFDFELSGKQFELRYVDDRKNRYQFDNRLYRAELNPLHDVPDGFEGFEDYICHCIEDTVAKTRATILIIDNITYLRNETEKARNALPLMKQLKTLKSKYGLSILALAHTPKRDASLPITRNDLQGSKMLINFCDSAFSIGECQQDKSMRYLKQIKQRNTEQLYGDDNVILYHIHKPDNYLHYEFMGYGREWEHLKQPTPQQADEATAQVMELKNKGLSLRQIGTQLGISYGKVARLLSKADKP